MSESSNETGAAPELRLPKHHRIAEVAPGRSFADIRRLCGATVLKSSISRQGAQNLLCRIER